MPATNESFIDSMNPSVGLRADIIFRLPLRSLSVPGLVLSRDLSWSLISLASASELTNGSRLSSGNKSAALSNPTDLEWKTSDSSPSER